MFVAYNEFTTLGTAVIDRFADPQSFPDAFTDEIKDEGKWRPHILIDDHYRTVAEGSLNVEFTCYLFYAKDKDTLKAGLKAVPRGCKVVGGRNQIGFFSGSYDFEKAGAWFRTKQKASKSWQNIESERRYGMGDPYTGLKQSRHDTLFNRIRLTERGYFMLVCRSHLLIHVRGARKMIGNEVSLNALGSMLTGKMTREQAVATLMDDLLVA